MRTEHNIPPHQKYSVEACCQAVKESLDTPQFPLPRLPHLQKVLPSSSYSDSSPAFRAEALGCLIIPIIICLAKDFIQQTQHIRVRHTCDNQGLVDQLSQFYKQERYHTIPDTADNDLTIPTAHWVKKNDSSLIWQQGHAEQREQDPTKWTNDKWANG